MIGGEHLAFVGSGGKARRAMLILVSALGIAGSAPASDSGWIRQGRARCTFYGAARAVNCTFYLKSIVHSGSAQARWSQSVYRWVSDRGRDVRYESHNGLLGVSNFTVGRVFDSDEDWGKAGALAVSYSPHREELKIGVPDVGYEFSTDRF